MAYENHLPPLSSIDQGTRDFDFIPLTELREFDEKLNEIIKKISTMNTSENADVNSMAYKLKEIEYNLADAIEFDENGNVVGLKSTTSDKFENESGAGIIIIPDQGPASYEKLMANLEKYYNEFVRYLGNDAESEQWKIDLQKIYTDLKTSLDNKIVSIFGNSALASVMEEKENTSTDFMKLDSVKLNNNEIVRLNPNVSNYTRNINLIFEKPGEELIAFEVECAEPDNAIFNMKLQNGDMHYNFNVILDNGEFHITKEEHFKLTTEYGVKLNIYKYITVSKTWRYVFTFASDSEDISKVYNFELSGIFIGRFIFDTNGAFPSDHENYWAFHAVDTTKPVDSNLVYYEKRIDDYVDETIQETNIVYTVVDKDTNPTPIPGEIYYVKTVDDTDSVVYKEYRELVEFDPEVVYYTKHTETTTDNSDKRIIYVKVDDLKEFEPGIEYFVKETEFIHVDKLEIAKTEYSSGEVDNLTIDHKGNQIIEENFKKVVGSKKYTNKNIKMMNIDVESSELLSTKRYEEKIANIFDKNIVHLDDSVRFTKSTTPGLLIKSRNGARKINNSLSLGFGSKVIELKTIRPHSFEIINSPCIKRDDITLVDSTIVEKTDTINDKDYNYEVGKIEIAGHTIEYFASELTIKDAYDLSIIPDAIVFDGVALFSFKDIIQNATNFVNNIKIVPIGCVGNSMIDFMIVTDNMSVYETCYHIYVNLKEEEIAIPVIKKVLNDGNEQNIPLKLQPGVSVEQIISCKNRSFVFASNKTCYETYNGKIWNKKIFKFDNRFTELLGNEIRVLGLIKNEYYDSLYAIIIDDTITDLSRIPVNKILLSKVDYNSDFLKFDDIAETMANSHEIYCNEYPNIYAKDVYLDSSEYNGERYYGIMLNKDILRIYAADFDKKMVESGDTHIYGINFDFNIHDKRCLRINSEETRRFIFRNNVNNKYNVHNFVDDESNQIYIFGYTGTYDESTGNYTFEDISYSIYDLNTLAFKSSGGSLNYTIEPDYYKTLTSLLNVDKKYKIISCKNDKLDGGIEEPFEGYFIYINTEDEGGAYYTINENNTELTPISIFDGIKVYGVSYCGDTNDKIAFAFTENGLYINKTTDPNNFEFVNTELTFNRHSTAIFSNNTDLDNLTWVISSNEGIFHTHDGVSYIKCEKPGVDSVINIGDIDDGYLIGKTSLDSIINDNEDGVYVRNIYDKDRRLYYKKVGKYKFAYGNGSVQTYIIDWISGDKKTYDIAINNIFDIDGDIYAYYNKLDGVTIYKFISEDIGFEDVTESYASRFNNPLNISNIQQDINGYIFLIGTEIERNKGVIYYGESLDTLVNVLTLSEDGVIDCFYIYDNEIIISTYEPYAETRHYTWDDKLKKFKYEDLNNINLIASFKRCFPYNGELYVMNGSGSHPNIVEKGFAKIKRIISNTERNGFYDIDVITPISEDFQIKHDNYIFSYANTLFGIYTVSEFDDDNELISKKFRIYVYYDALQKFVEVNSEIAPLLVAVVNMGNDELKECLANRSVTNNYTVAIQESYDESKTPILNYIPEDESENYQTDKIYFDRVNSGITIGNYASETNKFNVKARMAAIGITGKTHKSQLAMILGQDNLLGLYDKSMNVIKTYNLTYYLTAPNNEIRSINVDERFVSQNIFVASSDTSNYAFIILRGRFPTLTLDVDGVTIIETQTENVSYSLFKVDIDSLLIDKDATSALISIENFNVTENTSTEDIVAYINSTYGYSVADDMILNVFNDRQLVGIVKGFMYDNIESIVFWNNEHMCLDILSPLDWNINIEDIDAQYNRNKNYKDYTIAVDTVNNKAYQTYIDDDNNIAKNTVNFTVNPNELVRVGSKTYIADNFLKAVKNVTFKDTSEKSESAEINLNIAKADYENKVALLSAAQADEQTALDELNIANEEYQEALDLLNEALNNPNSLTLEKLYNELTLKIQAKNVAETNLNDAVNILNSTSVDADNYNEVLANKEAAQAAYELALAEETAAQEAYDTELSKSNSEEIATLNTNFEASKKRYTTKLANYNTARNNTSIASLNVEKALKVYEYAQMVYDSIKSKSLIDTVTFDNGLVDKIDSNIFIDRLTHTKFGAIAWDSLVESKLNPNTHNDLHYVIKKSGDIIIDTFTGDGIRYYNKALNTRLGLFRWYDFVSADECGAVEGTDIRPTQYNVNSDEYNTGWAYFTPTGGGKVITINPGPGRYIYRMWDTPFGVFMSVRNYRYYGLSAVEYWSLKRLIAIPTDDSKPISINDSNFFADVFCDELKILDCSNTQDGLFIIGHSNNKYAVLRYNGEDFYKIQGSDELTISSVIDTTVGVLFFTDNADGGKVYEYSVENGTLIEKLDYSPLIGNLQIAGKFGQRRTDVETPFGPQIVSKGGIYNFLYKKNVLFGTENGNGPAALQKIRLYVNNEKDNLPVIAEYLASKGLPMDTDIKCIGSIMYNGLQVIINGLNIISENGISKKPLTVKFFIDKNARFTRNRESIEALFGSDPDRWVENRDIAVISDYDPKVGQYYNIPCQISKMNFMALFEDFNNFVNGELEGVEKHVATSDPIIDIHNNRAYVRRTEKTYLNGHLVNTQNFIEVISNDNGLIHEAIESSLDLSNKIIDFKTKYTDIRTNEEIYDETIRTANIIATNTTKYSNGLCSGTITSYKYFDDSITVTNTVSYTNISPSVLGLTTTFTYSYDVINVDEHSNSTSMNRITKYYCINENRVYLVDDVRKEESIISGTINQTLTIANNANSYNFNTIIRNDKGEPLVNTNSMNIGSRLNASLQQAASMLLNNTDNARAKVYIGDYFELGGYTWESENGNQQQFIAGTAKYVLVERTADGHLIFMSSENHNVLSNLSYSAISWTNLITNNKLETILLPQLQSILGVTPVSYTRKSDIPHLTNKRVFLPTEYEIFGTYTYQKSEERYSGERQWEIFNFNKESTRKIFRRDVDTPNINSADHFSFGYWLINKYSDNEVLYVLNNSGVGGADYFGIISHYDADFVLNGVRPCFML